MGANKYKVEWPLDEMARGRVKQVFKEEIVRGKI